MNPLGLLLLLSVGTFAAVPVSEFVPFGLNSGDSIIPPNDDSFVTLDLHYEIPFFGESTKHVFINNNGNIGFGNGITLYTPYCTPLDNSLRMVMVFWADVMTFVNDTGKVYYRETQDPIVLKSLADQIRRVYHGLWNLRLSEALVVTWDRVSFFHVQSSCSHVYNSSDLWPRNTFQLVLATDETHSFAVFNYNKVVWTTGTASTSGGNCAGLGGNPARIGFDHGDQVNYLMLNDSCSDRIVTIAQQSNVGIPGKFIFKIDDKTIATGCDNTDYTGKKLIVNPPFVETWGNVVLTLQGPCFNHTDVLTCLFHDNRMGVIVARAQYMEDGGMVSAICIVPAFYAIGRIDVELLVQTNDGNSHQYSGLLYVVNPHPTFELTQHGNDLSLTWNRNTFNLNSNVTITILRYGEQDTGDILWRKMADLGDTPNTGSYHVAIPALTGDDAKFIYAAQLSGPFGTVVEEVRLLHSSYFIPTDSILSLGKTILNGICSSWYRVDPGPPIGLLPCPPTLKEAELDVRFVDDMQTEASINYYHPGGYKSYRSRVESGEYGSGQQCVYDRNGNNKVGSPSGGTADLASPQGTMLDHAYYDVLPWVWCCQGGDANHCQMYYTKRPSDSGSDYKAPAMGRGIGDPHIATLDGVEYTFNGAGEFWMIKPLSTAQAILVQGRTEVYGSTQSATVFTSFVFQQDQTSKVQISLGGENTIVALVDNFLLDVSDERLLSQAFGNITLTVTNDSSAVTLSFKSGFDFVISASDNALGIIAASSPKHYGSVQGLLGFFDGNPSNDLTTPTGKVVDIHSNLSDIHYNFGLTWMITKEESLFLYSEGQNYSTFNRPNFKPNLHEPDASEVPANVNEACGTSKQCLYDYVATGNVQFANKTRQAVESFNQTVQEVQEATVVVCPSVPNDVHMSFNASKFTVGGQITFSCFDGYQLIGVNSITCGSDGKWSNTPPVCNVNTTTDTTTTTTVTTTSTTTPPTTPSTTSPLTTPSAKTTTSGSGVDAKSIVLPLLIRVLLGCML